MKRGCNHCESIFKSKILALFREPKVEEAAGAAFTIYILLCYERYALGSEALLSKFPYGGSGAKPPI